MGHKATWERYSLKDGLKPGAKAVLDTAFCALGFLYAS